MNKPTIYHRHDGSVITLIGDCWPQENTVITKPTEEQLRTEQSQDFIAFFFQFIETNETVNSNNNTVPSPELSSCTLAEECRI